MKVLVVGGGAREHALCHSLSNSPRVSEVFCAPGNAGIAAVASCIPISSTDVRRLLEFAQERSVELTVIGPEASLAEGIVDTFRSAGLAVVGPTRAASMLETSKSFAKDVMVEAGVPTAKYQVFSEKSELEAYCFEQGAPIVLKADGLASGKGVFVINDDSEMKPAIQQLFDSLGAERVVAEELLEGFEVSCIFASNGMSVVPLLPAHDYKRLKDGDEGPNTGGMGAVCPTPRIDEELQRWIEAYCAQPIIDTMNKRGTPFTGFLYAGLMINPNLPLQEGVKVLEYNTRLGDPECQAILLSLESDIVELLEWMSGANAHSPKLRWSSNTTVCVVIASDGYPENVQKGDQITGLELVSLVPNITVFHASTYRDTAGMLCSGGGRTLSVVAQSGDLQEGRASVYKAVDLVQMRGRRVRRDIGV